MAKHLVRLVALAAVVTAVGCDRNKTSSASPPDDLDVSKPRRHRPAPKPTGKVVFRSGEPDQISVAVEVVYKDADVRRGLMYRRELAENRGMLFLMKRREVQGFWMQNTLIPLDMIFIDDDYSVVGVVRDTVPMDKTTRSVDKPSRYVLEVNAGWAKRHKVDAGTRARFVGVRPWPPKR